MALTPEQIQDADRRLWLANILLKATQSAINDKIPHPRTDYVVGYLLAHATPALSGKEFAQLQRDLLGH